MKNNFSDYISSNALKNGNDIFCNELNGESITYKEFNNRINQCCLYFKFLGLVSQSIISVKLENSIEYLIIYFSCLRSNIIINPLPDSLSKEETIKNIKTISPDLFISREKIFNLKNQTSKQIDISNNKDFFNLLDNYDIIYDNFENLTEDTACIYYSSGTTGNPKCVEYSHKNMISLIKSISEEFSFNSNDIFLGVLPVGHTAIINYQLLPCVMVGGKITLVKNFNSIRPDLWKIINKLNITNFQIVPTILFSMLSTPYKEVDIDQNKTLKFLSCGSAPLSINVQEKTKKLFNIPVANLYGLSETGPSHFDNPNNKDWKPGSIGFPLKVNKCIILDENNKICKNNKIGQIALKGENVFKGYFRNKLETKKAFFNDYFLTGDIGYRDNNGRFFFADRIKDLIIKGGVNIVPGEIEEVIYKIDEVVSAAVVGKKDKLFGEDLIAYVEKDPKSKINKIEIINFLSKNLQPLKVPRDIRFIEKMPLGPSGKILKKQLNKDL